MKNSYETMEDMQRMQQEAVRRVREMQKRAKQSLTAGVRYSESNQGNITNKTIVNPPETEKNKSTTDDNVVKNIPEEKIHVKPVQNNAIKTKNKFDFFSTLLNDHEKSLILVLILLLIDEGSDMSLVMALMYLII